MAARILPTPEQLRELLRYEPDTGKLFWLPRPRELFATKRSFSLWNTRFSGKEAFITVGPVGYRYGAVFGHKMYAHRVIWAMQSGSWPRADIDHINGCRTDNRFCNLRAATRAENLMNMSGSRGASGVKGVSLLANGIFRAEIRAYGKRFNLGRFKTLGEAAKAYAEAAHRLHGEFARTE
ncbi:HNH endonuclease [Delftia sp. ZNC0008]|uniref:HNH endonuclease n=1 Tax=Delftia sp. ZNC0008 TaxID=1339242 RepID=UPI000646303E|nr:HNH endonuclease [Delftia sp. ZNC0008]